MIHTFKFSEQTQFDLNTITDFNNRCFSIRGNHRQYDAFRFVDNPFASETFDYLYGVEKDGEYIAQMLTMPAPLSLKNTIIPAFWGQDYIVLENYRGEGIGKNLAPFYLGKDYYIAVGFSPKSAVIHQKMGAKKIGYLDFYQKWGSSLHQAKWLLQRLLKISPKEIGDYTFPDTIGHFKRIKKIEDLHLPHLNWNSNTVETLRDKTYFQWRFFYQPNRYFVYQWKDTKDQNATYFVGKPYFYKGVNWLRVVDYRFDIQKKEYFSAILKAAEKLRKKLHLYGILISSSLNVTREELEEQKFLQTKHEVVLTTYPFQHKETDEAHNHFFISFADSDMDMHTNKGEFNFEDKTIKNTM